MRFGATGRDELFADEQRKRQICEPVAMQMSQLAASEPKFNSAETVWTGRHARPRRYLTRDRLLDAVWGYENYPNTRTVDTHIVHLRQKLEPNPEEPRFILTVHGTGYKFVG